MKLAQCCIVPLLAVLLTLTGGLHAADDPLTFADPAQQQRFEDLLEELRCLVCQNQSLADSHADLAQDLRNEVYRMVGEGHDDAAILEFMVERYGDFVLYRPPLRSTTWLLWLGPLLLLSGAVVTMLVLSRRRGLESAPLNDAERERLQQMLRDDAKLDP